MTVYKIEDAPADMLSSADGLTQAEVLVWVRRRPGEAGGKWFPGIIFDFGTSRKVAAQGHLGDFDIPYCARFPEPPE